LEEIQKSFGQLQQNKNVFEKKYTFALNEALILFNADCIHLTAHSEFPGF